MDISIRLRVVWISWLSKRYDTYTWQITAMFEREGDMISLDSRLLISDIWVCHTWPDKRLCWRQSSPIGPTDPSASYRHPFSIHRAMTDWLEMSKGLLRLHPSPLTGKPSIKMCRINLGGVASSYTWVWVREGVEWGACTATKKAHWSEGGVYQ